MLKSLSILLFFCLLDLFPGSFESGSITVDFDRVSATTGDGYISFNFDWHLNSEEPPAWYNSSVLVINLTNPKLIYLASQLSPGHLRVVSKFVEAKARHYNIWLKVKHFHMN
jgi:hypothetical protein